MAPNHGSTQTVQYFSKEQRRAAAEKGHEVHTAAEAGIGSREPEEPPVVEGDVAPPPPPAAQQSSPVQAPPAQQPRPPVPAAQQPTPATASQVRTPQLRQTEAVKP